MGLWERMWGWVAGVRQPVRMTGMGEIVGIADAASLEHGIRKVLANRESYVRPRVEIEALFDPSVAVAAYESLFERLIFEKRRAA